VLGGGLLQTGFAVLCLPLRKYKPERSAVSSVYAELAKQIDPNFEHSLPEPLKPPTPEVQDTLDALGSDHSIEGERFRLLLDQADRVRISIFTLVRLREALSGESAGPLDGGDRPASVRGACRDRGHRARLTVQEIEEYVRSLGLDAYLVGGAVRDLLLGRQRTDVDVVAEGDPAGIARMNFPMFVLFTFVGSLIWCFILALAGQQLGAHWKDVGGTLHKYDYVVAAVLVVLVGLFIYRHRRRAQ